MSAYSRSVEKGDKINPPDVGTVGTSGVKIRTFTPESRAIRIVNLHASNNLLYSLDGGTTYETIGPKGLINEALHAAELYLKGSDANTGYNVRTTEAN